MGGKKNYKSSNTFLLISIFWFGPIGSVVHGVAFLEGQLLFTDPEQRKIYNSSLIFGEKSVYLEDFDYLSDIKAVDTRRGEVLCSHGNSGFGKVS